jgi:thymidylate kinase
VAEIVNAALDFGAEKNTKVVAFVGPGGSGKTTALSSLSESIPMVQSTYRSLNLHNLSARLVLSKWNYIGSWINEVLDAQAQGRTMLISDRAPLDTCAYISIGAEQLLELTSRSMEELASLGVEVTHVLMTADFDTLLRRVRERERLGSDRPHASMDEMVTAYRFYTDHAYLWNEVIDTTFMNPNQVAFECKKIVSKLRNERI